MSAKLAVSYHLIFLYRLFARQTSEMYNETFQKEFSTNTLEYPFQNNNDSSKKKHPRISQSPACDNISSICEIFVAAVDSGESSTCGQNGTTERCQYYGWWLKSCTTSHVSYTRVVAFPYDPLISILGLQERWCKFQPSRNSDVSCSTSS